MGLALLVALGLALGFATAADAAAPVLDCRDRISGAFTSGPDGRQRSYRFKVRPEDLNLGPVAFSGLDSIRRLEEWNSYVTRNQWIKSIALMRPGARVTLTVPEEQRPWMRLEYGHGLEDPLHQVTLVGCRRVTGARARRRECGTGRSTTCQRDRTPFSGGFTIDYAVAPAQGRCAELLIAEPRKATRRVHLFADSSECT